MAELGELVEGCVCVCVCLIHLDDIGLSSCTVICCIPPQAGRCVPGVRAEGLAVGHVVFGECQTPTLGQAFAHFLLLSAGYSTSPPP